MVKIGGIVTLKCNKCNNITNVFLEEYLSYAGLENDILCYNCSNTKLWNDGEVVDVKSSNADIFKNQTIEQIYASFGIKKSELQSKYSYVNMRKIRHFYRHHLKLDQELTNIFKEVEQW